MFNFVQVFKHNTDGSNTPVSPASEDKQTAILSVLAPKPVAGSGQLLSCAANATNYTIHVKGGRLYSVTARNGWIYVGVADATVQANRIRAIPPGAFRTFVVPGDLDADVLLNYCTDSGAGITGNIAQLEY